MSAACLYGKVASLLRAQIADTTLKPGDRLPTIEELAARYAVSRNTVNNAIDILAREGLLDSRRKKGTFVRSRQEIAAAAPLRPRAGTLGLIFSLIDRVSGDIPYYSGILGQLRVAAAQRGQELLLLGDSGTDDVGQFKRIIEAGKIDATIYLAVSHPSRKIIDTASTCAHPLILVDYLLEAGGLDSIMIDNAACVKLAIDHLAAQGHRKIGFVNADHASPSAKERHAAYRDALRAHGLPYHATLVHEASLGLLDLTDPAESLAAAATAALCFNDAIAAALITSLENIAVHVPGDFSVCGVCVFGIRQNSLPLTSVGIDTALMARHAVELILDRIDHRAEPPRMIRVGATWVAGGTIGVPRRPSQADGRKTKTRSA